MLSVFVFARVTSCPQETGRGWRVSPGLGDRRVWVSLLGFLDTTTLFFLAQRESVEGCAPNTCVSRISTDNRV